MVTTYQILELCVVVVFSQYIKTISYPSPLLDAFAQNFYLEDEPLPPHALRLSGYRCSIAVEFNKNAGVFTLIEDWRVLLFELHLGTYHFLSVLDH